MCKLSAKKYFRLNKNIKKILKKAIKEGGSSIKDFNNAEGEWREIFNSFLMFTEKKEKKCSRQKCVGKIKSVKISNRSSFFVQYVKNNKLTPIYWNIYINIQNAKYKISN